MPEMIMVSKAELTDLKERVKRLAADKSYLQLIVQLMNRMSVVSGLDNVAENMLRAVSDVIGGVNLILYYIIDNDIYYADVYGNKRKLDTVDDGLVKKVLKTRESVEYEHSFKDTKMITPEFTKAYTWVVPLLVGSDMIGVFKMESLHISMRELSRQLPTFFSFTALVLKNEILGYTRLKQAYDKLAQEVVVRKQAEEELRQLNETLEVKVSERTAELQKVNEQLRENEKQIRVLLEKSEQSRRALLSILEDERQVESALKDQYSTLRGIIDSTDALIFSVDKQYRYTSFNEKHAVVMKAIYSMEIEIGHSILDYMTVAEDRETAKINIDRALAGEQLVEEAYSGEELRLRRYFRVSHSPIENEEGEIVGVTVLAQDITDSKRIEDALRDSEQKYRSLIQKLPTAIVVHDGQGSILSSNPLARHLLGLSEDQLLGKELIDPAWHFLKEDGSVMPIAEYPASVVLSLHQPLRNYVAGIFRPSQGDTVWALVNAEPEFDSAGQIVRIIVSFTDITERKTNA